jgi:hypothetical protein
VAFDRSLRRRGRTPLVPDRLAETADRQPVALDAVEPDVLLAGVELGDLGLVAPREVLTSARRVDA